MVVEGNLAVVPANQELHVPRRIVCVIRDLTNSQWEGSQQILCLGEDIGSGEFLEEIAKKFNYIVGSFVLTFQCNVQDGIDEIPVTAVVGVTLGDLCHQWGEKKRYRFFINDLDGVQPRVDAEVAQEAVESEASERGQGDGAPANTMSQPVDTAGATSYSWSGASSGYTYSGANPPSYAAAVTGYDAYDTGFVGLVNQAMTCYLNSLLQTLYMSPEFRNALYRWEFKDNPQDIETCIPYQLQKIFLQLQTSEKKAVETTDLTHSFGWDSSEAWQQHDVQELCRVMFDALETVWTNTDQADLINRLYQGKMKDYVKCLKCGKEKARVDAYLDVPLTIRPFGATEAFSSVEEALEAFVQPETLDGNNQYFCEQCDEKCDAHKGLKFESFPYLLTLQLKRFDFDYNTQHRIKLNDRMTFPELLDLNRFLPHAPNGDTQEPEAGSDDVSGDVEKQPEVDAEPEGEDAGKTEGGDEEKVEEGESETPSGEQLANSINAQHLKPAGPNLFELFSIMIHSGSAIGGHYYAYIKSFENGEWYSFNDQQVIRITGEEIKKSYGGSSGGWRSGYSSSAYTSSVNAYMLMYRRVDKQQNADFITKDELPQHLQDLLQHLDQAEDEERKRRELERSLCKIKVFYKHPRTQERAERRLEVHKDKTLSEATDIVYDMMVLEKEVPRECCRLIRYEEYQDTYELSWGGKEDSAIGVVLGGVKSPYMFDLLLETRHPDDPEFRRYKHNGTTCKVHVVDLEAGEVQLPGICVRAHFTDTLAEFLELVRQMLVLEEGPLLCCLDKNYHDPVFVDGPDKQLTDLGFPRAAKVYVTQDGEAAESEQTVTGATRLVRLVERHNNTIRLLVSLPTSKEVEVYQTQPDYQTSPVKNPLGVGVCSLSPASGAPSPLSLGGSAHPSPQVSPQVSPILSPSSLDVPSSRHDSLSPQAGSPHADDDTSSGLDSAVDAASSPPHTSAVGAAGHASSPRDTPADGLLVPLTSPASTGAAEGDSAVQEQAQTPPSTPSRTSMEEEGGAEQEDENEATPDDLARYFKQLSLSDADAATERVLMLSVDKRITLGGLKVRLAPHLGLHPFNFKFYRVYPNDQEFEATRMQDNLSSYSDDTKLRVRLGRALRRGEYRLKVYELAVNDREWSKVLAELIVRRNMTVLQAKEALHALLATRPEWSALPVQRYRLRKKNWRSPGAVYRDSDQFEKDISIYSSATEAFLERIPGVDPFEGEGMRLQVYVRRWRPSLLKVEGFQEVVLQHFTVTALKDELNRLSGIPVADLEIAKGRSTFPCEESVLEMQTALDWNTDTEALDTWPLYVTDDGYVVYYRDRNEEVKELTEEERKAIVLAEKKDNPPPPSTTVSTFSRGRERALKITVSSTASQQSTASAQKPTTSEQVTSEQGPRKDDGRGSSDSIHVNDLD